MQPASPAGYQLTKHTGKDKDNDQNVDQIDSRNSDGAE